MTLAELLQLPALEAAQALIGWELTCTDSNGPAGGLIIETEAYLPNDPASHTFRGRTPRNQAMFKEAGTIYVYRSYGLHLCMNMVFGPAGEGSGVLIRALRPTIGISLMQQRRGAQIGLDRLCQGPGNVGQALGITLTDSGTHLNDKRFKLKLTLKNAHWEITTTPRIGISQAQDLPYRFIGRQIDNGAEAA